MRKTVTCVFTACAMVVAGQGLVLGAAAQSTKMVGKIVEREDEDDAGHKVTKAFLEDDKGGLFELPCEPKKTDKDKGLAGKAVGKAKGDDSCWGHLGERVEVVGEAQSVMKKGKRINKVSRMTGINPIK